MILVKTRRNNPAAGNAGLAALLTIGDHLPGVPEPGPQGFANDDLAYHHFYILSGRGCARSSGHFKDGPPRVVTRELQEELVSALCGETSKALARDRTSCFISVAHFLPDPNFTAQEMTSRSPNNSLLRTGTRAGLCWCLDVGSWLTRVYSAHFQAPVADFDCYASELARDSETK